MVKIKVRENGPLLVDGENVSLCDSDGEEFSVGGQPFALCRCGASENKPFCDGSHSQSGFQDAAKARS